MERGLTERMQEQRLITNTDTRIRLRKVKMHFGRNHKYPWENIRFVYRYHDPTLSTKGVHSQLPGAILGGGCGGKICIFMSSNLFYTILLNKFCIKWSSSELLKTAIRICWLLFGADAPNWSATLFWIWKKKFNRRMRHLLIHLWGCQMYGACMSICNKFNWVSLHFHKLGLSC